MGTPPRQRAVGDARDGGWHGDPSKTTVAINVERRKDIASS
jgi:hypothetical protein